MPAKQKMQESPSLCDPVRVSGSRDKVISKSGTLLQENPRLDGKYCYSQTNFVLAYDTH